MMYYCISFKQYPKQQACALEFWITLLPEHRQKKDKAIFERSNRIFRHKAFIYLFSVLKIFIILRNKRISKGLYWLQNLHIIHVCLCDRFPWYDMIVVLTNYFINRWGSCWRIPDETQEPCYIVLALSIAEPMKKKYIDCLRLHVL